jgi:hypothetical protein
MTNDELSDCFNDGFLETAAADFEEVDVISTPSDLIRALEDSVPPLDCGSKADIEPETVSIALDPTEADTLATLMLGYRMRIERDIEALEEDREEAENHTIWTRIDSRIDRLSQYSALLNRTASRILQTLEASNGGAA